MTATIPLYSQALTCETADLLCSINELDNFSSSMPASNPNDEPAPLCPGSPGSDGNPQNMTWFSFIAGSASAVLEITFTNCQNGNAVQYGVYTDCTFSEYLTSACEGDPQNVGSPITVNINGMVPGDDYFFFIDGDLGTYCDYSIDVISGVDPPPVPQPTALNCISSNCPSDGNVCSTGETFTFEPEGLDLSIDYIWTVDPSPPNGTTINGDNDFSATFNTPGTYEICVIGDNGCTQSMPVCYTLNVLEADAGMLEADPETLCPGGTSTVTASGYVDSSPIEQAMIAVGPDGTVIGVQTGETIDVTLDECGTVTVYSYNYNPDDSPALPNVGDNYVVPDCEMSCCDTESIDVVFEDNEPPTLSNTPADVTIECDDMIPDLGPVDWDDNCDGNGMVDGTQQDNYDLCMGGTITRMWAYTDQCMNTVEYTQTITINAQNGGTFDAEPEDMTFDCEGDIPAPMDLNWTGDCDGTAVVTPVDSGDTDFCNGGQVIRTWSYNDPCGGFTEHIQTFTINPTNPGMFIDPPANTTAMCDQSDLLPMEDLAWEGDCEGTATVSGIEDVDVESCFGGTITRTWTYTDACGTLTEHIQVITVSPPPLADPINPPPPEITVNCDEIPSSFPTLTFTNGQTGDCTIMGDADPEIMGDPTICGGTISVLWIYTDDCFNVSSYVQMINILPAAEPEFIDAPADMTISCVETFPMPSDLDYTNNETGACEISGTIEPLVTTEGDICGGDVISIWEFTDECGVVHSHTQTIIIEPKAEPEFVDPPSDLTVACSDVPGPADPLSYSNGESGLCEIMGSVDAVQTGSYDVCGGTLTNSWEFTDDCGRLISYVQTITVEPAPEAVFTTLPEDITIGCDEIPPSPPALDYENGNSGTCEIIGSVDPEVNDNSNSCGGEIEYMWQYTDACGRTISHAQLITIEEAPEASYTTMPADVTVNCGELPPPAGPLDYTNGDPCEIMGSIDPIIDDNNDICGGQIINTWDFTDECGRQLLHIQTITINPAPEAAFQDIPVNTTVDCGDEATNPGDLSYTNSQGAGCLIEGSVPAVQSGSYDACGGEILFTWEFTDQCGRTIQHVQTVVVEPASQAAFIDPPADITVSCADFDVVPPSLSYSNNESDLCEIAGNVAGVVVGNPSPCGVDVMYRWEFIDECGRSITYNQNVTIEEAPIASFINPPADMTLNCEDVSSTIPSLNYSNNASGVCLISGAVTGIQSGFYNECGGEITYTWTFTDVCNRAISHSQMITVNPAAEPDFINPPSDITLDCGEDFPEDPPLDYTNNLSGSCDISGTIIATSETNGPITTYTWTFTNVCNGGEITYIQNITGVPTPDISIDPDQVSICIGESFDLSTITVVDANGNPFTLTYEDGNGNLLNNSVVTPSALTTYTVIATNDSGCFDEAMITINVDDPANAGTDGSGQVCGANLTYNLFDYIGGNPDQGGTWFDTDGSGVNIDDPFSVNFTGIPDGIYNFTYTVFSTNSCPDATAVASIEVIGELEFEVLSIECAPGGATYIVNVFPNGNNIFSSLGDVTVVDANTVTITNIPAGELVVISAIDQNAFCITDIFVNPPDCDCPEVDSPISNGDIEICEGEDIPDLSVTVAPGNTVNWYEDQTSQDPIATMTNTYTPTVSDVGVYIYYAETEDENGCVSLIRTPITLTIFAAPEVNDIQVEYCENEDGEVELDLQSFNLMINSNANFEISYYISFEDASAGINVLDNNFVIDMSVTIYAVTTNTSGCSSISEVLIIINLLPSFTIEVTPETCFEDGNGSINIIDIIPAGVEFSLDNSDFSNETTIGPLVSDDYTLYAMTSVGCSKSELFTIEPGILLQYEELSIVCDDNGTSTSSDDDFYTIQFEVFNNQGNTGMVEVSSDTENFGSFAYGTVSIIIDAGGPVVLTIVDVDSGCSTMIDLGQLSPCSTSCEITIDQLDIECDGNGTTSDPNDDVYIVTINASAVNGSSNNTFNVLVDGNIVANFQYGAGGQINIPAQGQSVVITLADNEDDQCFATQNIGPLTPCSSECIIAIDNQNFICDNNGTIGVPEDDFYDFSFTIIGTNTSSGTFDLFVNGSLAGTFNYGELSTFQLPADGSAPVIEFIDSDNENCVVEAEVPELTSCSGSCTVSATLESVLCFNENTADDPLDDTFTAVISVDLVGGSGIWEIISTGESGTSGQMVTIGPFLISDGAFSIEIIDPGVADCLTFLEIIPPPECSFCEETVEAGVGVELDCDITEADLMGQSSIPGNGSWSGPGFSVEGYAATVDVPGTYYFTVDFGDSCIRTDSLVVSVSNDIPQVNLSSPLIINCVVDSVELNASITGGSGNFTYQWTDESMTIISSSLAHTVGEPGNYFFEVYDIDTDCKSPPILLEVLDETDAPSALILADPGNILDCVVDVIYLSSEGEPNVEYRWYIDNVEYVTESLTIEEASMVELLAIDTISGCRDSSSLIITNLEEYPIINVDTPELLDCINGEVVLDGSASQSGSNIEYTWFDDEGNLISSGGNMISVSEDGFYVLQLIDQDNNCVNTDTILVESNFDYPELTLSDELEIRCDATNLDIELLIDGNQMDYDVVWTTDDGNILGGQNSSIVNIDSPGTYYASVQNSDNKCETLDTVIVNLPDLINEAEITILDESCELSANGGITIENISGGSEPYSYFIDGDPITGSSVSNLSEGSYLISVIDDNGCTYESTVDIDIQDPFEINLIASITLNVGENVQLSVNVNIDEDEISSITWSPSAGLSCTDCLNPSLVATNQDEIYTIEIIDINGCSAQATIQVLVVDEIIIIAPNIFSPNNDNSGNENFTIYSNVEDIMINSLQIFDRWGNLVFNKKSFVPNDPEIGWDGSFNGKPVTSGVFVFYAEVLFPDGTLEIKKGDITIVR